MKFLWGLLLHTIFITTLIASISDWDKIDTLQKAWKQKEALSLQKVIITKVTKLYVNEFKEKYQKRMQKKIEGLSDDTKALMLRSYEIWIKYLNWDPKIEAKFIMKLYSFFQKYNENRWNAEKYAKWFKSIQWLPKYYTDAFINFWKESDLNAKEEIEQWKIINNFLIKLNSIKK